MAMHVPSLGTRPSNVSFRNRLAWHGGLADGSRTVNTKFYVLSPPQHKNFPSIECSILLMEGEFYVSCETT